MAKHILIPKDMQKSVDLNSYFQINNTKEERRVCIEISETCLEISIYGDLMWQDIQALEVFGLLHCGEHRIKNNKSNGTIYLVANLNERMESNSIEYIFENLQKCYAMINQTKSLRLKWLLHSISYEMKVTNLFDKHPTKEVTSAKFSTDQRAPDIP
jgi:hypothetical protein